MESWGDIIGTSWEGETGKKKQEGRWSKCCWGLWPPSPWAFTLLRRAGKLAQTQLLAAPGICGSTYGYIWVCWNITQRFLLSVLCELHHWRKAIPLPLPQRLCPCLAVATLPNQRLYLLSNEGLCTILDLVSVLSPWCPPVIKLSSWSQSQDMTPFWSARELLHSGSRWLSTTDPSWASQDPC